MLTVVVAAFEDFLTSFKSSELATEASATNALQSLNIDEDGLSDEYDFMEDAADAPGETRSDIKGQRDRDPKKKYMEILQNIADRQSSEICVELDDLDAVCSFPCVLYHALIVCCSMRKVWEITRL